MLACDEGNIEMVDLLLQYSADPNLQQPVSNAILYLFCFLGSLCMGQCFSNQAISHVVNCMHATAIHILRRLA